MSQMADLSTIHFSCACAKIWHHHWKFLIRVEENLVAIHEDLFIFFLHPSFFNALANHNLSREIEIHWEKITKISKPIEPPNGFGYETGSLSSLSAVKH